jgi:23S rRNA (adenine1618-N6)-methyltransferase
MSHPSSSEPYRQKPYYAQDVDFDDLAARDPEWAAICKTSKAIRWLDFQDPKIVL